MVEITANGTLNIRINKAGKDFEVDLSQIAPAGLAYLIHYGLKQSLNDGAAGALDQPEAEGKAQMRLDAILAGTMGQRRGSSRKPVDPVEAEAMRLAGERVKVALKSSGKTLKEVGKAKVEEMTGVVFEGDKEKLLALAKKTVESIGRNGSELDAMIANL